MAGTGGKRDGAGRKTKAEEMGLPKLIEDVIGDEGKAEIIRVLFQKARTGSYLHLQLLMAYIYGKPQDHIDLTSLGEQIQPIKEIIFRNYAEPKQIE